MLIVHTRNGQRGVVIPIMKRPKCKVYGIVCERSKQYQKEVFEWREHLSSLPLIPLPEELNHLKDGEEVKGWRWHKEYYSDWPGKLVKEDVASEEASVDGIGEKFIKWAEQYWRLREIVSIKDPDSFAGEICDYDYMRNIFVKKIDSLIKEMLYPSEKPQSLNIIK